ncbi:MAG: glycosyltransferase family 4 protein [Verrucomicrobiota bacterium]
MKILFDHSQPFLLGHGGFQIQIERTLVALNKIGVQAEYLRWWDDQQRADLIHYFSPAGTSYLRQAKSVRTPVVMTTLFTETCNRSDRQLRQQGWLTRAILALPFGRGVIDQLRWKSFRECSINVVGLEAEQNVLKLVYGVPEEAIAVIPLGLSEIYLQAGAGLRSENHLICTGTITRRKNPLLLAEMARRAEVPILFVGKPYHSSDPYWREFERLIDQIWVKYHPHVAGEGEMAGLLKAARGYVLLSDYENWCLSAHEAVACGLPVLVPNQKWSRERFGDHAHYFSNSNQEENIERLRAFHQNAPALFPPKIRLHSWEDVAGQLKSLYESVLSTSR